MINDTKAFGTRHLVNSNAEDLVECIQKIIGFGAERSITLQMPLAAGA